MRSSREQTQTLQPGEVGSWEGAWPAIKGRQQTALLQPQLQVLLWEKEEGMQVNLLLRYLRPNQRAGCSVVGPRPSPAVRRSVEEKG